MNVKSLVNVSQIIAKQMVERKEGGSIVNLSSQASKVGLIFLKINLAARHINSSLAPSIYHERNYN